MKVYAINGSPRRNRNTAKMLDKVLEGVKAEFPDAEVERIKAYRRPSVSHRYLRHQNRCEYRMNDGRHAHASAGKC